MRLFVALFAAVVAACLISPKASAQEREVSRETLETMRSHAAGLRVQSQSKSGVEEPLKLVPTPVLRYSDAGGITTDASIWAWGDKGRPAVLAGIFFLTQENREPKWSCELLSLADEGVAVSSAAGWNWAPKSGGLEWLEVKADAADSPRQRLRRMKDIADRYEVAWSEGSVKSQLRLMVQPLYRYADEKQGLVDGAIFSFASGTNPEAVLIVECRAVDGAPTWRAAFARFGAAKCEAREGTKVVWECPGVQRWEPKEPYFSVFGPVEKVFKAAE